MGFIYPAKNNEAEALKSLYCAGSIDLSIKSVNKPVFHSPTDLSPQFLYNLTPLSIFSGHPRYS